jgi:hypothetical protein
VAARIIVWMARAADGSLIDPSAAIASRVTRGSDFRSSGWSSGTASGEPMRPSSRAPVRWTNQRASPTSEASRGVAAAPNSTMSSSARCDPRVGDSIMSTGLSASTLDGPISAMTR